MHDTYGVNSTWNANSIAGKILISDTFQLAYHFKSRTGGSTTANAKATRQFTDDTNAWYHISSCF